MAKGGLLGKRQDAGRSRSALPKNTRTQALPAVVHHPSSTPHVRVKRRASGAKPDGIVSRKRGEGGNVPKYHNSTGVEAVLHLDLFRTRISDLPRRCIFGTRQQSGLARVSKHRNGGT